MARSAALRRAGATSLDHAQYKTANGAVMPFVFGQFKTMIFHPHSEPELVSKSTCYEKHASFEGNDDNAPLGNALAQETKDASILPDTQQQQQVNVDQVVLVIESVKSLDEPQPELKYHQKGIKMELNLYFYLF